MSASAPSPDPRVGLHPGFFNAGEAIWNLQKVSSTPPSEKFFNASTPGDPRLWNSDLAFMGNFVIQGNFGGMQIWDISNPSKPTLKTAYVCPGSQSDVSVYHNLLMVSSEATNGRIDCGTEGVQDTVSKDRARGIRIYDITDMDHPKEVTVVQTCRGSHTNTLVTDPTDKDNVYIYVSGSAPVRSSDELPGCVSAEQDANTALFRIEVIQIPIAHPEQAHVVSSPRIFANATTGEANGLTVPTRHSEYSADSAAAAQRAAQRAAAQSATAAPARRVRYSGVTQCHDITVYPAVGFAGGACGGYGLLLDIHDVKNPKRIDAAADSNMSFWHSATFNNDGTKVLFSDEWGGGTQPRCRATDNPDWGADAIFTISNNKMAFHSYYKMLAPQTSQENCVAHNGSLIPIPGRDVMVQAWYQGGISIFDWTDPSHPKEIAYFDRGPIDSTKLVVGGFWSAYWYNGYIVGSEIARGLDIFELKPSAFISKNEIAAAKSVRFEQLNVQDQPKLVWPKSFSVARAYLDQLARNNSLSHDQLATITQDLDRAEHLSGQERQATLTKLQGQLERLAQGAGDPGKVRMLASEVGDLATTQSAQK